jgi:DNA-binding transcriptional LysR family regulator
MELRHLRYFVAVAEEQNVTRAAARLHVSQPPLTRQIHDLEEELGVELFERAGRSIRLTRAGRVFLTGARAALRRVDDAVRAVRATAEGGRDEIHIGYAPTPSAALLPAVLRAFRKAAPRVRVVMHDLSSPEMLAGLREGRIQAAFMMQPSRTAARGIRFQALRTLPVVVAVPPDHPFARRSAVSMSEVQAEPLVGYSRRQYPDYHEFLARHAGLNSKRVRFAEECDSGSSLITAVASGRGVAITLASLGTAAGRRLRLVPLTPTPKPGVVGIAWRTTDASERTRQLVQMAADLESGNARPGR